MIKKTFKEILGIDDDDYKIIEMLEKDADVTHSQIAREIEKSQPAVGARIIKLERKNLLTKQVGFNIKKVDIKVAIVFVSTKDVEVVVNKIKQCPFVNHAFKISGEFNLLCFIAASDLQTIEKLVDLCFRKDPNVINVKTNILIDSVHDFVVPIDFQIEKFDYHSNVCGPNCNLNVNLPKYKFDTPDMEDEK
ncbi:MAG: Lrp/AsnC family transcriptional regulator [Candidatus Lokiarchaeota archaeon]|nr:Lrp/AsnC family transcriptional regulator [Candidatus Lokiarchaeota archaeon]